MVKPSDDIGSNSSGCIFSEKSQIGTNAFAELQRNSLTDLHDVLRVENESKVPERIRERNIVRVEINRVWEGNDGRFREKKKVGKKEVRAIGRSNCALLVRPTSGDVNVSSCLPTHC